jgi:hypothetical protein
MIPSNDLSSDWGPTGDYATLLPEFDEFNEISFRTSKTHAAEQPHSAVHAFPLKYHPVKRQR